MTQCENPRCSRQAPLTTGAYMPYWDDGDEAEGEPQPTPVCVPCYLAIYNGSANYHNEVIFEVTDHSILSDTDREALTG